MIRVGNAPVSWGVYEADRPNPPFGRILDEIAGAGYQGTELGPYGYLPTDASALARELESRRLGLGSSFVALPLATQRVAELILADDEDPARARIAGRVEKDGRSGWSDAQWREAAATIESVARALRDELGMRV